jgi:pimeloyl-ACP methyl ester carboxylesterase
MLIFFFALLFACGLFFLAWWRYSENRSRGLERALSAQETASRLDGFLSLAGLPQDLGKQVVNDTVTSDGFLLHLDIFPAGDGDPVVVFVPGTAVYAMVYAEFMHKLSGLGFHVIGFDPRGHGQSQGLRGSYTVSELVRDTRAVIRYARERYGRDVFVVGSSQGGIVAFYTAAEEPDLRGVVCHNLADLTDPETLRLSRFPALSRMLMPLMPLTRLIPEFQVPIQCYLDLKKEENRLFGNALAFLEQAPMALRSISLRAFASLAATPLPCPVEEIQVPVLVLHAEHDNIFPLDYVQRIFRKLPAPKRFHLARGRPHLLLTDCVDEMLPPVERWLRDRMARRSG